MGFDERYEWFPVDSIPVGGRDGHGDMLEVKGDELESVIGTCRREIIVPLGSEE